MSEDMAWPGRGQGAYRSSSGWMFATAEEILGRRAVPDNVIWPPIPAPTESEALFRESNTRNRDISMNSGSRRSKKNGQNSISEAVALSVRGHENVETAGKTGPQANSHAKRKTETPEQGQISCGTEETTIQRATYRGSYAGGNPQTPARELHSAPQNTRLNSCYCGAIGHIKRNCPKKQRDQAVGIRHEGHDAKNKANEEFLRSEEISQKKKPMKDPKKSKHASKGRSSSTKVVGINTGPDLKKLGGNEGRLEPQDTANTIQECVSLLDMVKNTVRRYRMQSPAHFTLHIDIQLADTGHVPNCGAFKSQLNITFQHYSKEVHWLCKQYLKKGRPTQKVMVCNTSVRFGVPLSKLLAEHFPVSEAWTSEDTLRDFWNTNGKSFDWARLPTELKEHVIQFCIVTAPSHPDHFHDDPRVRTFDAPKARYMRSCELIDRLSRWKSLLRVSTQVRAITLRLCFSGSLTFDQGLCMTSYGLQDFSDRFSNLEQFSQITEPNCVPTNVPSHLPTTDPGHLLRAVYRDAPKLYPELRRYGTFAQQIRKIDLSFDLINFYRFFKVEKGGFGKEDHRRCLVTYDVLEKMPHLNQIVIRLPGRQHWINKTHQIERPLFDTDFPCPRLIFRILYERIAEALAAYGNVSVTDFLDETEEERFWGLRKTAAKALQDAGLLKPFKLTIEELQEIGTHDGGGLQLTHEEIKQVRKEEKEQLFVQREKREIEQLLEVFQGPAVDQFYPIRCGCAVSCQEQYEFYPSW